LVFRHFFTGELGSSYYALKIPYEKGRASQREAAKLARIKHQEDYLPKVEAGLSPTSSLDIIQIARRYKKWVESATEENIERVEKGKDPINKNFARQFFLG
jgi:hypothetical protein